MRRGPVQELRRGDGEPGSRDHTRERLVAEAARLFSAHGFARVTVRDICSAARANVAAVNYHFHGGKAGLYDAVVRMAIERMQQTTSAAIEAGRGKPSAQQLAAYVEVFLQRVVPQRDGWIHQLMLRELSDPTAALQLVVREVLDPRMRYLSGVVAALLHCRTDDVRVLRAAMSVHWLCLAAIDTRLPVFAAPPRRRGELHAPANASPAQTDVADIAAHIVSFSLGGIRELRASRPRGPARQETGPARRARPARRPSRP